MATAGIEIVGSTPAEFGAFFRAERTQWAKVVTRNRREGGMNASNRNAMTQRSRTGRRALDAQG